MADNVNATMENEDTVMFKERKRWLFLGLPWTFTKYTITPSLLTVDRGFLSTTEDDCYMYKIQDVKLTTTLLERIVGLGTITCYTGDTTDKVIEIKHIKDSEVIKDYIIKASEAARIRRRTVNMQNITADGLDPDELDIIND